MGRFNKGVFLGGVLGAALVWLNTTTKGKQYRNQLLDAAADIYERVKEEIMENEKVETLTKHKYVARVKRVVDTYARENELAQDTKDMIVRLLSSQWTAFKKEIKR